MRGGSRTQQILDYHAAGLGQYEIAERLGITQPAVSQCLSRRLQPGTRTAQVALTELLPAAVELLAELLNSMDERVRLQAVQAVTDRAGLHTNQVVTVENAGDVLFARLQEQRAAYLGEHVQPDVGPPAR